MEQKFKVNQMLTNRTTGHISKIYAVTNDGQPFDLLDITLLTHYEAITLEGLKELFAQHEIAYDLQQTGRTYTLTLITRESADAYVEYVAPLFNQILS